MRVNVEPGGSIGTPTKVTEFPDTVPWNTFGLRKQPPLPTAQPVAPPGVKGVLNSRLLFVGPIANAAQPEIEVQVCAALVWAGATGSSIVRIASDWLLEYRR